MASLPPSYRRYNRSPALLLSQLPPVPRVRVVQEKVANMLLAYIHDRADAGRKADAKGEGKMVCSCCSI
jgi:hypothetical protein